MSFFSTIPSILIPLRLCEPVDQRLIVDIWSKRFDCTCAGPSLEIPSPCSVPACCLRFVFHFRPGAVPARPLLLASPSPLYSAIGLLQNLHSSGIILSAQKFALPSKKTEDVNLSISANFNKLERYSHDLGSPEICFPSDGRARIMEIPYYAIIIPFSWSVCCHSGAPLAT